jgi:hypothetical protein
MANGQRSLEALLRLRTDQAAKDRDAFISDSQQKLSKVGVAASTNSLAKIYQDADKALDSMVGRINKQNQAQQQNLQLIQQLETRLKSIAGQKGMEDVVKATTQALIAANKEQQKFLTNENEIVASMKRQADLAKSMSSPAKSSGGGFGNAASQLFGAAGIPGGGLIGAAGPYGALIAGVGVASKALNDLGERASKTSEYISDNGGKYDQLRQSTQQLKEAQDRLAASPLGAAFEKLKNQVEALGLDALGGAVSGVIEGLKNVPLIGDAVKAATAGSSKGSNSTKLIGDAKVQYDQLKHDRITMEHDIAQSELEFKVDTERKVRDLKLETAKFEMEQSRKKADLEKNLARENQDYAIEKQKLTQDQAFKTSQAKFAIDQQFEMRAFQQKMADENQTFQLKQGDARQDFALQQSFKAQDLAKELGRGNRDFGNRLNRYGYIGCGRGGISPG